MASKIATLLLLSEGDNSNARKFLGKIRRGNGRVYAVQLQGASTDNRLECYLVYDADFGLLFCTILGYRNYTMHGRIS